MRYRRVLITLLFLLANIGRALPAMGLDGAHTWVFAVGLVEWSEPSVETFDSTNRADTKLVAALLALGVPKSQVVFLQDKQATAANIQRGLSELLQRTQPGDRLIFYYAGHGAYDKQSHEVFFLPYDVKPKEPSGYWFVRPLLKQIDRDFHGRDVLYFIDACHSGVVADLLPAKSNHWYSALTSAQLVESSTEDWTFTDELVAGLSGDLTQDLNNDGFIDLDEVAQAVRHEMAFTYNQFPEWKGQVAELGKLRLSQVPAPLTPIPPDARKWIGRHVWAKWKGKEYWSKVLGWDAAGLRVKWYKDSSEKNPEGHVALADVRLYEGDALPVGTRVKAFIELPGNYDWVDADVIGNWFGLQHVRAVDEKQRPREWWVGGDYNIAL